MRLGEKPDDQYGKRTYKNEQRKAKKLKFYGVHAVGQRTQIIIVYIILDLINTDIKT